MKLEKTKRILAFSLAFLFMLQAPVQALADYGVQGTEFEFLEGEQKFSGDEELATDSVSSVTETKQTETGETDIATESMALSGAALSKAEKDSKISDDLFWTFQVNTLTITTVNPEETEYVYSAAGTLDARNPDYDRYSVPWAEYLPDIQYVDVGYQPDGDIVTPYYMNGWFDGMENAVNIIFLGIDTSRCKSFTALFRSCEMLDSLDLTGFNTKNAVDMSEMFKDCHSLGALDVNYFDTSRVTCFDEMFLNCQSLSRVNLDSFNTGSGTSFVSMFEGCSVLEYLPSWKFDTSSARDISYMFKGCEMLEIEWLDFNTSNVQKMTGLFQNCSSLRKIDLGDMSTEMLIDAQGMFDGCTSLEEVDLSPLKMQYVMTMSYMFRNCSSLEKIDLSQMETQIPVKTMEEMFAGCSSLKSLTMTEVDSPYLVSVASMFEGCTSLTDFSVYAESPAKNRIVIDTSSVQDMSRMFYGCDHLAILRLCCDTSHVPNMDNMLTGCVRLERFLKGASCSLKGFGTESSADLPTPDPAYITGAKGYWYNNDSTDQYLASELPESENDEIYRAVYGSVTYNPNGYDVPVYVDYLDFNVNYQIKGNVFQEYTRAELASPAWNTREGGNGTAYNINDSFNTTTDGVIRGLTIYAQWKESPKATHSVYWKNGETVLAEDHVTHGLMPEYSGPVPVKEGVKFIGWEPELSPVLSDQTYTAKFTEADTVTITWDWNNATVNTPSQKETFDYPIGSEPVYETIPVKTDPDGIYTYTFAGWNPSVTTALKDTTYTAEYYKTYSNLLFWNYESGRLMISSAPITGEIGGGFRSSLSYDGDEKAPWYKYRRLIKSVCFGVSPEDIVRPVRMDGWFDGFCNLTNTHKNKSFDFSGLDASDTKSMRALFRDCGKIAYLNISDWNTSAVEDFEDFMSGCVFLEEVQLPHQLVTGKTVNTKGMFRNAERVKELEVSGFDTRNVTDFSEMFANCYYLTDLDVSGFRTAEGVYFDGMFANCGGVKALDVSAFTTPKALSFTEMFHNCAGIGKLDLSGFTVAVSADKVTDMLAGLARISELKVGDNCDLTKTGLPGPNPEYVEHADGYWHKDGKSYAPDQISEKGTYGPIYGWITYDPNGRPGQQVREYLKYKTVNYKPKSLEECGYTPAEGMEFVCWTTNPDGTGSSYDSSKTLNQAEYEALFGKVLYAKYKSIEKTDAKLTWKNYDGSILKEETVQLHTKAKYTGTTPASPSTAQYTYTFSGWDPQPGTVEEDTVFTAQFTGTVRTYTVTWFFYTKYNVKNIVDRKFDVPYGTVQEHTKVVPEYEDTKWTYTFKRWLSEPKAITGDTEYEAEMTAASKAVTHQIRWVNWDDSLILQETVQEGQKPKGPTSEPVRPDTAAVSYKFAGWDSEPVKAMADHTYKATYTGTVKSYILVWSMNGQGNDARQYLQVGTVIQRPENPTAGGYDFGGWYYDANCTSAVQFGQLTMPASALILYARWTKKSNPSPSSGGGGVGTGSISSRELNANNGKATFSRFWKLNAEGKWIFVDDSGTVLRNAWLCDDAVAANRSDVWYLLKADGTMLDAGLVQDQTGNFYSLEMNHNGYYGMLRYKDGYYDGIYLEFVKEHNGSYGAIKNRDGIEALKKKYGVTVVNIGNQNIVYSSSME